MVGKNNQYLKTTKEGTRVESYSIKKFKVGTASVVIGASIFLGAGAVAQASEEVSNNTTNDNATNAGAKEEAPKAVEKAAKVENTKESVAAAVAAKVGAETPTAAKAEVKKEVLKATIATLEENLKSAQDADQAAVAAAKEALTTAKAVLTNEAATQAEVDAQVDAVSALNTVVTEAKTKAFDKKLEAKKAEEQKEKEAKATKEEKEVAAAKKELTQVASEAQVTNTLAKTELSKKDLKVEAKPAVEKAVVKNEEALKLAKELLGNDKATKEQIAKSLEELSNSIKAVYAELENAGARRNGKFDVVLADATSTALKDSSTEAGQKWLADHGYSSLADIPIMNKGKDDKELEQASKQIQWLDFTDPAAWTNLDADGQLQIGSTFKKELMPGYVVTLTVKEMKPFHATETYKNRVAGTDNADTYNPDAVNSFKKATGVGGSAQTYWAHVKHAGFDTDPHKTTIAGTDDKSVQKNGTIAGVVFSVDAEYNGKKTKPTILMTSGEDIKVNESEIYTTNGTPWDLYALVGKATETNPYEPNVKMKNVTSPELFTPKDDKLQKALANAAFSTPDTATAGLGSQVFGSYINGEKGGTQATPIVSTAGATEVGFYIISGGAQSSMIGISLSDFGDLPESYGKAEHSLRTTTTNYATNQTEEIQQPYLGKVKADPEAQNGERVRGIGSDDATDNADEGVAQLIAPENVHINKDNGEPEVKIVQGKDNSYRVKVIASANGNDKYTGTVEPAYVRGFIDFNNNGKFDEGEASDIVKVTGNNETVELVFRNTQVIDTTKDKVNFRTRIAKSEKQVTKAASIAYSGEVEDNQIQVALPPRGDKEETTGKQGETQSVGIEFISRAVGDDASDLGSNNGKTTFNSYGKLDYSEQANTISAETTKKVQAQGVMIVDPEGNLVKSYTKAGQGTYTVLEDKVVFTPEANFVGKADGIVLRAVDANGHSTGWTALTEQNGLENINDGTHTTGTKTMDAVYIPTVTPKEITAAPETSTDIQGKAQKKTPTFTAGAGTENPTPVTPSAEYPAKLVDPKTGDKVDSVTVEGEGTYTINPTTGEVTFQPLPTFTGTASGVGVSLTAPVGQDKDGNPVTATATTTYTPTVTPVTPTADPATSTGVQGETQKGTPTFTEGNTETPIKEGSVKLLNPDGTEATGPVDALDPSGKKVGEYTVDPTTGVVTFTPTDKTYVGPVQPVNVQAEDKNGTKVKTTYTPTIVGVTPTAEPATTEDVQGKTQESTVSFEAGKTTIAGVEKTVDIDPATYTLLGEDGQPATEVPAKDPEGNVIGKYTLKTVDGKAVAVFEPTDKTYSGDVQPVRVQAKDKNGTAVETTYTPKITPVTPTAEPAQSVAIQGETQKGTPKFAPGDTIAPIKENSYKLLDKEGNEVPAGQTTPAYAEDGVTPVGTYSIDPATGEVTFTPTDKSYTGKVLPAEVQGEDANGTKVSTTYTPSIIPAQPTAEPAKTVDVQGATQTGKPVFQGGTAMVNGEEKTVEIDDTVPAKLVDPKTGDKVDSLTVEGEGTYTVAPDGTVTFTPEKTFTGVAKGVEVVRQDKNGTPAKATYTPEVKPVTPTGTDAVTEDIQGATQTGKPEFKGGKVTINGEEKTVEIDEDKPAKLVDPKTGNPVDSVTIEGEGTYTVAPDGTVTFTPEKNFTGKATGVTVQREDKNGTPVTAKYTPVVKKATPTGTDAVTEDVQGSTQKGKPTFEGGKVTVNGEEKTVEINEDKPAKLVDPKTGNPVDSVTIEGEGTYTVAPDGTVTFTPEKNFTGKGTGVTVQREDKNGTPVTAKYTPVVKPTVPTSTDVITTNVQGATQSGTPTFEGGKVTVNGEEKTVEIDKTVKPTFEDGTTEKKVPGEGTYTIDENGTVTFTPEKTFTGQAKGVTVKRVDKNGTPVTAKYTPVVIPVTPTSKDTESEGPKGQPQSGTPTFEGGKVTINGKEVPVEIDETVKPTFEDGTTEKKVPGEGTYTIDENGKVTFTPEPNFVGKASGVTVKRVDKNGTPVTAKYTPTVRPDTTHVDKDGNPLSPSEDGTKPTKDIPGYKVVKTEIDEKGNTKHIYEKVTTTYKDKDGNVIPGTTTEEGTNPKKDIPGYRFVETKKLPNGDTEHVYEKVKTSHKDKDGNEIPNYPTEDGDQPKKDIPGYRFVETKKLPNGDVEHVYEKVKTSHKDKDGNEIPNYPTEDGDQPKKDIPGYRFVETKKLPNGDIEHVYEKVKTSHKDKEGNEIPNYPTEDGEQPKKDIPGYRFVETKKLPNGDIEHVYEKVTTPAPTPTPVVEKSTTWVDENGNPLKPTENGTKDPGSIPGYELVNTVVDKDGNVRHIFRKVTKPVAKVEPKAQPKRLANTGATETNTGLAGLGLAVLGLAAAARRRKEK